ncbi:MAG: hypothetical protein IKU37_09865 [Candidatus Gastranaerophilales bacterium]|nr:hypothetical protein [Candidatus Gastranaerophilales bacterium]
MLIITGCLALCSLPLEADSRMYHFSRIFEYIYQQSFLHFDTNETRNIIMPINSEMIYSYFYIFKKNEFGFGLLSYFSFIWLIIGLYELFKELNFSARTTLFSIFVFSSFGIIISQIPYLQTDLIIASLSITSLYLFTKNKLYFSSLAYALAIGTKTTAIINFVSFFIIILSYTLIFKKNIKNITKYLFFLFLNFVIFSSYNYILNYLDFGNFITNKALFAEHYFEFNKKDIINNFKNIINDSFFNENILFFDERKVGFSYQGIFVFIPCLIYSFLKIRNKRGLFIAICSSIFILNFLIICFNFVYSEYLIRYFVSFFAFSIFCFIYGYYKKIIKNFIIFISILNLFIFPFLIFKYPIIIFNKNENLKENILLKKQKNIDYRIQYKFLLIFKEKFKKENKIAILNHINFYEIKQLKNLGYQIDTITLNKLIHSDMSKYDYVILAYWGQTTNALNSIEDFKKDNKELICKKYAKKIKNEAFPAFEDCHFNGNLLNKKGFKLEEIHEEHFKKMIIYKKI